MINSQSIIKTNCERCIWADQCGCEDMCEHYSPAIETDIDILETVEEKRIEYIQAWFSYLKVNGGVAF